MHTSRSWVVGPFELNTSTYRLRRQGVDVPLEPKAFEVLCVLVERAPAVVEKSELFELVWRDVAVTDNALTRVIAQLRKALDDDARSPRFIETVATRGYRLIADVQPVPSGVPAVAVPAVDAAPTATHAPGQEVEDPHTAPSVAARANNPLRGRWLVFAIALLLVAIGVVTAGPALRRIALRANAPQVVTESGPSLERVARVRPVQVTTGSGLDAQPAISADGTTLAFSSDRSGRFEIYVQGLTPGASATQLTNNGRVNIQPAWSPDGRFIAYHEAAGGGIWVVPSRGGTARRLVQTGSDPTWSPDGRTVAYQTLLDNLIPTGNPPASPSDIQLVDVASGTVRALTQAVNEGGPRVAPRWSADGRRVYFIEAPPPFHTGGGPDRASLVSVDVATGTMRREATSAMLLTDYALAPDGSGAWMLARTGVVWWLPLAGAKPHEARPSGLPAPALPGDLVTSADGRWLAWTAREPRTALWSVERPGRDGRPAKAGGVSLGSGVRVTGAVSAPDGRLAYSGIVQGAYPQIWVRETDGAVRQVTLDQGDHANPTWLPGFREVAFYATHPSGRSVNIVDVTTGAERTLFRLDALALPAGAVLHPTPYLNIAVDPSASHVVFAAAVNGVMNLWVSDLGRDGTPSAPRQLTFETQGGSFPHWSPDSRWVSYQCDEGRDTHVCVIGLDRTGRRQLTREPGQSFLGGWMGPQTILVAARRDAVWNVIGVDRESGRVTPFTDFTEARGYVRYPQWDDVARRIYFERAETTGNIWMAQLPPPVDVRVSGS